jgi:YebC/PmpR family DNA-binding regulatory protein
MGRIFEKRKHKMFARYDRMAKTFTRIGKEIAIAVKQGGPDPDGNPRLRAAMRNAKAINMPKDRIEAAVKRSHDKGLGDFTEVVYEGYLPHGVAVLIETATDNPTRTVANVRMYLTRGGGSLGKTGSLDFIFERKALFKLNAEGLDIEELELELIDHGLEEIHLDEGLIYLYSAFTDYHKMQTELERRNLSISGSELVRIPLTTVELNAEQEEEINELVEKIEDDDDVQQVFVNVK